MALDPVSQPLKLAKNLPVAPLRGTVIFPGNNVPIVSGRPKSRAALDAAWAGNRLIVFVAQKNERIDDPSSDDLFQVGTVCLIKRIVKIENEYQLNAEGLVRVYIKNFKQTDPFFEAEIEEIPELYEKNEETEALVRTVKDQLRRYLELSGNPMFDINQLSNWPLLNATDDPNQLVNTICQIIEFKTLDKQQILEMVSSIDRLQRVSELMAKEIRILEISQKISTHTQERVSRMTKEAILREQMRSIEEELGENGENSDVREIELKIRKANMPKEVREKANKELNKLAKMSSFNPEAGYIRNYLEWLTDLPWKAAEKNKIDMKKAQAVLDSEHYGLKKVKERIMEYLAVYKLSGKINGSILCFAGPPGTGKTSIGKSIAKALGRKFVKVSLGGIRDEAEIRGHRRTYVGSMPGRMIQSIKQAGTTNPVFMLDEIDKIGADYRGDPSAALLEALDPEQNKEFSDHYLEVPYDLSNVMFITTANMLDTIPPALRDRLEIITYPGYTREEKFHIAKNHLIPKVTETHGVVGKKFKLTFEDEAIYQIIDSYTREAGVRNLEREVSAVIRKVARKIAEGEVKKQFVVNAEQVRKLLGPVRFIPELAEIEDMVGTSTGLAWTEAGGDIMFLEVTLMPGKGAVQITGQLGDVMKESAQAAVSYVRTNWAKLGLPEKFFHKFDIHIHVPEGAVPKDGPSAGISLTTAIVSAFTRIPVRRDVAMTGEVTLRGRVLEIGGLKEKVIAAHRAGVKEVIVPDNNKKDLEEMPQYVLDGIKFHFVKHMDEVLQIALTRPPVGSAAKRLRSTPAPALA